MFDHFIDRKVRITEMSSDLRGTMVSIWYVGTLRSTDGIMVGVEVEEFWIGGKKMEPTAERTGIEYFNTRCWTFSSLKVM